MNLLLSACVWIVVLACLCGGCALQPNDSFRSVSLRVRADETIARVDAGNYTEAYFFLADSDGMEIEPCEILDLLKGNVFEVSVRWKYLRSKARIIYINNGVVEISYVIPKLSKPAFLHLVKGGRSTVLKLETLLPPRPYE